MKPSAFFIKTRIDNQRWYDSDDANEVTIRELDKRFIDKEELKEKIRYDNNKIEELEKRMTKAFVDLILKDINYNLNNFFYDKVTQIRFETYTQIIKSIYSKKNLTKKEIKLANRCLKYFIYGIR